MDGQRAEKEAVGVAGDPGPADFAKAEEPKEVAGDAGGHLDESRVAVDDPTAERASLVEDDTNMVTVLGGDGDSFVEQDGQDTGSAAVAADDYGNEPKEDAGVGVRLDDVGAAADDSVEVDASLIDDAMNVLPVGGGASFDGSQGIGGGVHGEAAGFVLDVQDDGPQMDRSVTVSGDNGENVQGEGALLDAVDTTVFNDAEADLVKASDSVLEESTGMDIHAPPGDDNEEMVAMACDAATDEDSRKVDAVSSPSDHNEDLAIGAADFDVRDEDMQLGTVDLSRDDNVAKESVAAPVNGTDDEDLKIDAAISAGNEDGEDVKADNTDRVPEEVDTVSLSRDNSAGTKVGAAGDDGTNEEGVQMDVRTTTGGVSEEDGKADEEDGKADENVVEDDDGVSEEAVAGSEDIPEEDAVQMDEDEDDDDEPPPLAKKGGGRRKRGRASSKAQAVVKPSVRKKDDEEVCFICFDGGDLVVCDRRGCPKAYHPSCVNRDDEFFKSKGRWNCGWHICSNCQKPARHMCFTCTYSLCNKCIKETKFVAVRANKGFCETCMDTVMLIENKEVATEQMDVDFDDKTSFWYLFKDYWLNLKEKLSLTFEEISAAKSQKNGSLVIRENDLSEPHDTNDEEEGNSDSSSVRHLESNSKRKGRKRSNQAAKDDSSVGKDSSRKSTKRGLSGSRDAKGSSGRKVRKLSKRALSSDHRPRESESVGTSTSSAEETSWASKELLDFVANMKNGDKSMLSQFEVQSLLLEYIKRENLRDPRRKSQIICDSLLKSLFGKARVGHFEMLKLLESHFLMSEVSPVEIDDNHGGVVDPDPSLDGDGNSEASIVMSSEKKKKSRKYDQKALQTNLDDYAAIDNHNIGLMYLRRNLLEELISEVDTFDEKVLGTFVRIRISGTGQRQDIYRLVQIVGTGTAPELYKCGKKSTDITLEILNLDKKEVITIDITSNQEFTEEECKRLRQSIKCGFIPRLTVGEVYEKAKVLQSVKVNDWIESEKMRLGHLRDRASDMGQKLQLLSTPEERVRRLNEDPEVHADHTMDPDYESPEEQEEDTERSSFNKSRGSFFRKDGNPVSPGKGEGRSPAHRDSKANWESNRNTWGESSTHIESPLGRRPSFSSHSESKTDSPAHTVKVAGNAPHGLSGVSSEITGSNAGSGGTQSSQSVINESEKIWQYVDPTGKIQGPFSILQLRKWNSSGYFPPNLKIWKSTEKQDDSILLTDALLGKFEKDLPPWEPPVGSSSNVDTRPRSDSRFEESTKSGEQPSKSAVLNSSQSLSGRVGQINDTANLGSATIQSSAQVYYGMQNSQAAYAVQQSLTGSWNTSTSQFGTTINPMTLSQPSMGNFSVGQTAAVGGQLTSVQGPATISAEVVNSQSQPQNQIASLSQSDGRLADGNDSKLGADASHERTRPLGEGLGLAAAQPGAVQSNTQQHEEARSHLQNAASNSVNPSQLMSTPSAQAVQPSPTTMAGGDTQNSGWTQLASTSGQSQGAANMPWGTTIQGNANMGWGMMGQNNMNMSWGGPAQSATGYNMALTMPAQPNAVSNMGWVTPNPGNTNMNMMWAATQGQGTPNAAAMMGTQMQGVAMAPWGAVTQGNTNSYSGWGAQVGNLNQNAGWGAPMQSNAGPSTGNGTSQGNNNMNWNSPSGNTNWNNQQRDNGGRHSGHGGDSGGRSWRSQSGGDGGSWGNRRGVCFSMLEKGYCRKGESCRFSHSIPNDGYPSRNDRHFDRQNSGNERRYDRQNDRTDRQFDRQSSGNERHDDMDNSRDSDRHDERQTDRSQSRERQ
uniref:Zinc finger CCCH domain-containing protein 19 n=1 Tax=Leersia perrieri TaxID=77586 RepID=A0A0D9XFY3_9ORYZ